MQKCFALLVFFSGLTAHGFELPCAQIPTSPLIAVIDTGADIDHPELRDNLWINPGETGLDLHGRNRATNGVDDDQNGFVDDVNGWDFASDTSSLTDHSGHGTHIAGLISSAAGTSAKMMILKYFDPSAPRGRSSQAFLKALAYAIRMKADVLQISGGGDRFRPAELRLLQEAQKRGITVVAASGNKRPGQADRDFFPASYNLPNIISVAAVDDSGRALTTTNLIPKRSSQKERGFEILSALPKGTHGRLTGSSQAAGVFTGKIVRQSLDRCRHF